MARRGVGVSDKQRTLKGVIAGAGALNSEEDVKNKVVVPFLLALGWDHDDISFPLPKEVNVGSRTASLTPDVIVALKKEPLMTIETKGPSLLISKEHIAQSDSYALLYTSPPTPLAVTTNGRDWNVHNVYTGVTYGLDGVLSKMEAAEWVKARLALVVNPNVLTHAAKVLITITHRDEFMRVFGKCAEVLNRSEGLLSEQAFDEMSKILACKMNEERRALSGKDNRFSSEILKPMGALKGMEQIFKDTKSDFKEVFEDGETIGLRSDETVLDLVKLLEPFDLYGTGEDIKGAVYESFLSGTLRGELGQYFTPRELVEFAVELADPKVGEKIIDIASGSGGFLVSSFTNVLRKIGQLPLSPKDKESYQKTLIDECLWGVDLNPRLVKLCKLNLMIHGDGYNHIERADSLKELSGSMDGVFDLVITNPPFDLPIKEKEILKQYATGRGRTSQGSDVLFLEKCINICKPGGRIAIVLPWGILNLPTYDYVRRLFMQKCIVLAVFSLPEGAFIPFGQSHAKTCILYLRKKADGERQGKSFGGIANEIGYDHRRKHYKKIDKNDLPALLSAYREFAGSKGGGAP